MDKGHQVNDRDRNGWRIPREGTLSRKIYDRYSAGQSPREIAKALRIRINSVRVLSHRFRNPDWRQQ